MKRPISELKKPDIADGVEILMQNGLGLEVEVVELNPRGISAWQEVDQGPIDRIAESIRFNGGWPDDLPLIIVGKTGDEYEVVDGNHRRAASIQAGLDTIPVLAVDMESVDVLGGVGADLDLIMEVFAANSPEMDHNQDLRWLSGEDL